MAFCIVGATAQFGHAAEPQGNILRTAPAPVHSARSGLFIGSVYDTITSIALLTGQGVGALLTFGYSGAYATGAEIVAEANVLAPVVVFLM